MFTVPESGMTLESLVNVQLTSGTGSPVAKQVKVTSSPSLLILDSAPIIIAGGPEREREREREREEY